MQDRFVHRAAAGLMSRLSAGLWVLTFVFSASGADASVVEGYSTGSGANTSRVVVDFGFTGGDAYVFTYRYDGEKTGVDMLRALDDAGALGVAITDFSFGAFVDGFAFSGNDHQPGFEGTVGENFSYWLDGGSQNVFDFNTNTSSLQAVAAGAYAAASAGPSDRFLADGSLDGWVANVSSFNSLGNPATSNVPAVPEPATAAVLIAAALVGRRR